VGLSNRRSFLDGGLDEAGIGLEAVKLGRVRQQCQQTVADQVCRRLVTREEQHDALREQVLTGEGPRLVGGDEIAREHTDLGSTPVDELGPWAVLTARRRQLVMSTLSRSG